MDFAGPTRNYWITKWLSVLLCAAGALLSAVLLISHLTSQESRLLEFLCDDSSGACDEVLSSPWSTLPPSPRDEDEVANSTIAPVPRGLSWLLPVPVAMLGVCHFVSLAIWLLMAGRETRRHRLLHLIPVSMAMTGCIASMIFVLTMAVVIEAWCPLCLTVHGINFVLAATIFMAWSRKPNDLDVTSLDWSARHAFATGLVVMGACGTIWGLTRAAMAQGQNQVLQTRIDQFVADTDVLAWLHYQQEAQTIPVRPDDVLIAATPGKHMRLVMFTDFQCGACVKFEQRLVDEYVPLFQGGLEVVVKHFPLCKECNQHIGKDLHPAACQAARLAEAARLQGGNASFAQMRRLVSQSRSQLWSEHEVRSLATEVGLDADRFQRDWNSRIVRKRVDEDIALARELGVTATPTVFLNGRRVDGPAKSLAGFWKLAAGNLTAASGRNTGQLLQTQTRSEGQTSSTPSIDREIIERFSDQASRLAEMLLRKHDANGDGVLRGEEIKALPDRYRIANINEDNEITVAELTTALTRGMNALTSGRLTTRQSTPAGTGEMPQPVPSLSNLKVGQQLTMAGPTLDGGAVDLAALGGNPTLIVYWASWCGYCQREMPAIQAIVEQYRSQGLRAIGVSLDNSAQEAREFVCKHKLSWPQIFFDFDGLRGQSSPLRQRDGVAGVPLVLLVDAQGIVQELDLQSDELENAVRRAIP